MKLFIYKKDLFCYIDILKVVFKYDVSKDIFKKTNRTNLPKELKEEDFYTFEEVIGKIDITENYIFTIDATIQVPFYIKEPFIDLAKIFTYNKEKDKILFNFIKGTSQESAYTVELCLIKKNRTPLIKAGILITKERAKVIYRAGWDQSDMITKIFSAQQYTRLDFK